MASNLNKTKNILKENIKKYRKMRKLTQFELAIQADVSEKFIQSLEGGRRVPSFAALVKLAEALKVETYELLK